MPHPPRIPPRAILFEDDAILVVDKPAGLLTIGTDKERERTAYFIATEYVRKGNSRSRNRIFIVHRLDRETSGVLLFAKTEAAKFRMQSQWEAAEKIYLAVVQGQPDKPSGSIKSYLVESKALLVYSTNDAANGKLAHTEYRVLKQGKGKALLEVKLHTGRKNQIRVHLADLGHPIIGDKKYGGNAPAASSKPRATPRQRPQKNHGRMALHAHSISFNHPTTGQRMTVTAPTPGEIEALLGGKQP